MEGQLKVTPEELQNASAEFSGIDKTIMNTTQEMMTLVKNLVSAWEGESSQAYINKFNELEDDMQKIHAKIEEHVQDLTEMATVYSNAEKSTTSANQAVSSNLIS